MSDIVLHSEEHIASSRRWRTDVTPNPLFQHTHTHKHKEDSIVCLVSLARLSHPPF